MRRIHWEEVESLLRQHQPNGRLPRPNDRGWIGPIHSPLRVDRHPSFSVLPDSANNRGAFVDHATGDRGSMADLSERLGIRRVG